MKHSAETLTTIAADPKHLGARVGITSVLHTWGSALTHHPHIHMIVPGGGISLDGERWVACRPGFFLPVRVLSRLFRRLFLERLLAAHPAGRLAGEGLQRYTPATITDWKALSSELEAVLERGWAGDAQELVVGEVSLAAPIDDRRGVTVGAIGISGPVERLTEDGAPRNDLVSFVREAARAVSRDLGAIPW